MEPIKIRARRVEVLWQLGLDAENQHKFEEAYRIYTEAHDLIMDCARLHQKSHEKLRRVNFQLGNYGELIADWLLHCFAPLGIFELVAYFAKTDAFGSEICLRK